MQVNLYCPSCHNQLNANKADIYTCNNCNKEYPIRRNIPILIDDEKSVFSISDYNQAEALTTTSTGGLKSAINKTIWFLQRAAPNLTLNVKAKHNYSLFAQMLLEKNSKPKVLIIGGRTTGMGMEDFIKLPITFIETDIAFGPNTKIICDAHNLPFKDEEFDGVVIQAVMEYLVDPYQCAAEIHRVLKADGLVYAETPFMQQVHGGAHDFTRLTHLGHRRLFRNFEEVISGACVGTGTALATSYKHFLMSLSNKRIIQDLLMLFAVWTSFFLKYFDRLSINKRVSYDAASGYYFLGKKSTHAISDKEILKLYRGNL